MTCNASFTINRNLWAWSGARQTSVEGKLRSKAWIDLHGRDVLHRIDQREGQRPQTRANLQHMILGGYLCGGNDPADGVGIMNEVLTQLLCRPNIELIRQLPNLRRPEQR